MKIEINPKNNEEIPVIKVKKGLIGYTEKYKYLGEKGIIILYNIIYKQEVFLLHLINTHVIKPPAP